MDEMLPPTGVTAEDIDAAYRRYEQLQKRCENQMTKSMTMVTNFNKYVMDKVKEHPQIKLETQKLECMKRSLMEILRNSATSYDQKLAEISSYLLAAPMNAVTNKMNNETTEFSLRDLVTKVMTQSLPEYMSDFKEEDFKGTGVSKEAFMNYMTVQLPMLSMTVTMTLSLTLRLSEKKEEVNRLTNAVMEIVGRYKTKADTKVFELTKFFLDAESTQKRPANLLSELFGALPQMLQMPQMPQMPQMQPMPQMSSVPATGYGVYPAYGSYLPDDTFDVLSGLMSNYGL